MTTGMALSVVLLIVLAASLFYIIRAEGGVQEIPHILERAGIPNDLLEPIFNKLPQVTPIPASDIPTEFQSGNSRFSQGTCFRDENCFVAGCSGEVCGANPDVATTCEFSESFPNKEKYSCTCLSSGVCGWE